MVILTSLIVTLLVVGIVMIVLSCKLIRRLTALQIMETRIEHVNDALALLTEATEAGFRSTGAELQRVAALQRIGQGPSELQDRLERAAAAGDPVHHIASEEGLSESEVQLRLRLARLGSELSTLKENHVGQV